MAINYRALNIKSASGRRRSGVRYHDEAKLTPAQQCIAAMHCPTPANNAHPELVIVLDKWHPLLPGFMAI